MSHVLHPRVRPHFRVLTSSSLFSLPPQEYEQKLSELEKERETIEEEKAQVDKYKKLLVKQRDIMVMLTQRLNERDEQIVALQDELDAYVMHGCSFRVVLGSYLIHGGLVGGCEQSWCCATGMIDTSRNWRKSWMKSLSLSSTYSVSQWSITPRVLSRTMNWSRRWVLGAGAVADRRAAEVRPVSSVS